MFIKAPFKTAPDWKQPRCPSMGKWSTVVHPRHGIPLSNKKEQTSDTGNNMDEPEGNDAGWKKQPISPSANLIMEIRLHNDTDFLKPSRSPGLLMGKSHSRIPMIRRQLSLCSWWSINERVVCGRLLSWARHSQIHQWEGHSHLLQPTHIEHIL